MVWGAIADAGIGLVGGLVQGNQQRASADAQNKEQEKIASAVQKRQERMGAELPASSV